MQHRDCETRLNTRLRACALAVAAAFPAAGLAAPAARVEFSIGNVQIVNAGGQARAAQKGAEVNAGDSVNTNAGRVQLRFTDGAYVSLQPGSQFRIDDYNFNGKTDGTERGFFSLLQGGLRTITGLVGRTNRKNYQVTTAVATIGIRGTEYTLAYTNSITGSVGEGEIEVCNLGGCSGFSNGEAYLVPDVDTRPVLTDKKSDLPPVQPSTPPASYVAGDQTSASGAPIGFFFTGTHSMNWAAVDQSGFVQSTSSPADVIFNDDGSVRTLACPHCSPGAVTLQSVTDFAADGIFTWGRGFSPGSGELIGDVHYVAGLPTPLADIAALKQSGVVMTYAFSGGTRPTAQPSAGDLLVGELLGGSATLHWGTAMFGGYGSLDVTLLGTIGGTDFTLESIKNVVDANGIFPFCSGGPCSVTGGGSCAIRGAVGGNGARGIGMVYHADLPVGEHRTQMNVTGAAAFQAPLR